MSQISAALKRCFSTSSVQCFGRNDYYIRGKRYPKKYWNTLSRRSKDPYRTNYIEQSQNLFLPRPSVRAPYDRRYPLSGKSINEFTEGGDPEFPKFWAKITSFRGGTGVPEVGYKIAGGGYRKLHDSVPEFIVPDLKGFELKPYVTYRAETIYQEPLTPVNIFDTCIRPQIERDFEDGKLDVDNYKVKKDVEISEVELDAIYKANYT